MGARLFTAVLPPVPLVEELDAFLAPRRQAEPRLRWTRPETWHLTTAFMADVPERSLDRLVEHLAGVADRTPPLTLRLAGAGAFGPPMAAKALWLGVTSGSEPLASLARRCRNAAGRAGVEVDGARFVAHLTLARANRPVDARRLLAVLETFDAPAWTATEFLLIESHLGDPGRRYEVVERFALRGAAAADAPRDDPVPDAPTP